MKFFDTLNRLKVIVLELENENTGNADELAAKLNISRRMLYNYFEYLQSYNIEIKFDRKRNTYFLKDDVKIEIKPPFIIIP